jgi:hypothetical protein
VQLPGLPPRTDDPTVDTAQRFLASAYDSVEAVLEILTGVRKGRKERGTDIRGRLPANEEDLLRAALVFTGAGLDATLKQLIRDTLPILLESNDQAHSKFEDFALKSLGTADLANLKMLARYLTSANPRQRLIEDYIYNLTGSSLQSAEEVRKAASALGVDDPVLHKRISGLRDLFIAWNQISHELDLQRTEKQGDRSRRSRGLNPTKKLCHEGLEVGQLIVNEVGALLRRG